MDSTFESGMNLLMVHHLGLEKRYSHGPIFFLKFLE
jgi:hypothetical protein